MEVTIIGTGNMARGIGSRVLAGGHDLTVVGKDAGRAEAVAADIGAQLAAAGITLNYAPTADVNSNPDNPVIGVRSFGADPDLVARHTAAWVRGLQGTGVAACAKHFPGHGRPTTDSHVALPEVALSVDEWAETDGLPFAAAVAAGVPMVMLGHLRYPYWDDLPTSISPAAVAVLRERLGFDGVVVSDDLGMGALSDYPALEVVRLAIEAGNDMLLFVTPALPPSDLMAHLVALAETGDVSRERMNESARRILALKSAVAG